MSPDNEPDDQTLIDYLLGVLSGEEAEHLDELSVTDDGFAARLSEVENELIDAYVAGRLGQETRRRIETRYQSSAAGQRKVGFAEALRTRAAVPSRSPQTSRAHAPFIFPFALIPALRGATPVAKMVIPRGTDLIRWTLTEVDEFPSYEVAILNVATEQVVWREGAVRAGAGGASRSIDITIAAAALEAGTYVVELSGISPGGAAAIINGYPVRVLFE
jgi:hypothetical protein